MKQKDLDFKSKMKEKEKEIAKMEKDFNLVSKIKEEIDDDEE